MNKILILGAGELGSAIIDSFLARPTYSPTTASMTVLVRQNSLPKYRFLEHRGVSLIGDDIYSANVAQLSKTFSAFTTVIHAGNMSAPKGTQVKITRAVLDAGVPFYVPWQFGVDYDIITRAGGDGMFSEAIEVREMIRSQKHTQWLIISCGIFMSFLFEPFWGVVERDEEGKVKAVHALGSWEDSITATDAMDIGRCTADLVLDAQASKNRTVYIAGDTMTYSDFADVVEKVAGVKLGRYLWTTDYLMKEYEKDPSQLKKYRVVFSEGRGLSWSKERTWNQENGMEFEGIERWFRRKYEIVRGV